MKGLILTADDFQEAEFLVPYYRLQEEGLAVDLPAFMRELIKLAQRRRNATGR